MSDIMDDLIKAYVKDDPDRAEDLLKGNAKDMKGFVAFLIVAMIFSLGMFGIAALLTILEGKWDTLQDSNIGYAVSFLLFVFLGMFMVRYVMYDTFNQKVRKAKDRLDYFYGHLDELGYTLDSEYKMNVGYDDYEKKDTEERRPDVR